MFPESPILRQALLAFSIGVRDDEWAAPTEAAVRELWKNVALETSGRMRLEFVNCYTFYCVMGELMSGSAHLSHPPETWWWGGSVFAGGVKTRADGWHEVIVVNLRHARDYPAFHPRMRSTDMPSSHMECSEDSQYTCTCACLPFTPASVRVTPEMCEKPLINDQRPHRGTCVCQDRWHGGCSSPFDIHGLPKPFPTPEGRDPGEPSDTP